MNNGWHDLTLFVGRFHVLVVHLPIGGLVLLGLIELLARIARFKEAAQGRGVILGLTTAGAIIAAGCSTVQAIRVHPVDGRGAHLRDGYPDHYLDGAACPTSP